jgi:hypothetical protein
MSRATLDKRTHLLHDNVDAIMVMLAKAIASGRAIDDVAVIVADTRDPIGRAMAQSLAENDPALDPEALASRALALGKVPTLITVLPAKSAVPLFSLSNPPVGTGLARRAPAEHVHVVAVAAGGATLVAMPLDLPTRGGTG